MNSTPYSMTPFHLYSSPSRRIGGGYSCLLGIHAFLSLFECTGAKNWNSGERKRENDLAAKILAN